MQQLPKKSLDWLCPLIENGVDIVHCSQRRFWEAEFPEIDGEDGLNFAGWVKKVTGAPTISIGSVGLELDVTSTFVGRRSPPSDLKSLTERMERGEFDMIAVGRAILNDPHWVSKARAGRFDELQSFTPAALGALLLCISIVRAYHKTPFQELQDGNTFALI